MDVRCEDDLDLFGGDLDDPLEELRQDVIHMLLESYGSNPDALERSIDLEAALSGPEDPALAHRIESKLREDDRIDDAEVTITEEGDAIRNVEIRIVANEGELGITFDVDASGKVTVARS